MTDNNLIRVAVRDERTITFTYKGEVRTVKPELLSTSSNGEYLTGFDLVRDAPRRFILDNILEPAYA